MTMSPALSILLVGLLWDHRAIAKQVPDPTIIRDSLDAVSTSFRGAGYTYDFFPVSPDDVPAKDALVAQLKERSYDGAVIGFGCAVLRS